MENNRFDNERIEKINELIVILNRIKNELLYNNPIISNGEPKRNARIRMIRRKRRGR